MEYFFLQWSICIMSKFCALYNGFIDFFIISIEKKWQIQYILYGYQYHQYIFFPSRFLKKRKPKFLSCNWLIKIKTTKLINFQYTFFWQWSICIMSNYCVFYSGLIDFFIISFEKKNWLVYSLRKLISSMYLLFIFDA